MKIKTLTPGISDFEMFAVAIIVASVFGWPCAIVQIKTGIDMSGWYFFFVTVNTLMLMVILGLSKAMVKMEVGDENK